VIADDDEARKFAAELRQGTEEMKRLCAELDAISEAKSAKLSRAELDRLIAERYGHTQQPPAAGPWIAVEGGERPPEGEEVLVWDAKGADVAQYRGGDEWTDLIRRPSRSRRGYREARGTRKDCALPQLS
jgi:hypothetical protein